MIDDLTPPPHAEGPEKSLLSSMLQTPEVYVQRAKAEGLTPSMFYTPSHARLYSIFLEKHNIGETVEIIELTDFLMKTKQLETIGGPSALTEIYMYAPSPAHFASHLEIVRDRFAKREAIRMAAKVVSAAHSQGSSGDALKALSEGTDAVRLACAQSKAFKDSKSTLAEFMEAMKSRFEAGDMPGASTGIPQLDAIGGGMRDGEFWVICGETSAGKSCLSYQVACPVIAEGKHVLIFTLEMGAEEVFARLISCHHRTPLRPIMNPKELTQGDIMKIKKAAQWLGERNLQIADTPNMSIDYICAQAEQYAESHEVGLVIVDYIQLIEGSRQRGQSREQELASMSRRLKQLAKKVKCPVISPAQLNDDGKLRDSRAIGHDADVVLKITDAGINVAKFRNSQRNDLLPLKLNGAIQRFEISYD